MGKMPEHMREEHLAGWPAIGVCSNPLSSPPSPPQVQLNENIKRIFSIRNNSRFSFTFTWELCGPAACQQVLTITPWTGTLQAEKKAETQLAFHPQKMCSLKDVKLTLQVRHQHLIRHLCLPYAAAWQQEPRARGELHP